MSKSNNAAFVRNYLDASTAHISAETNEYLETVAGSNQICLTVAACEYGYFISVPPESEYDESVPDDLRNVLDFARDAGCFVLRLDADADKIDGLPTFNW